MSVTGILNSLLLLAALLNGAIGTLVLVRNSSLRINRLFFLLSLGVTGWAGTNVLFQTTENEHIQYIIGGLLSYGFAGVMALTFFLFSESITGSRKISGFWRIALLGYTSIVTVLSLIPGVVATGVEDSSIITHVPMLMLYAIGILVPLVLALWMLLSSLHRLHNQERRRVQVVLLSFSIAVAIGVVCNLILPLYDIYSYVGIGPLGSLVLLGGTAYAIIRNQLFDIRAVLARTVAYIISLALLAVFYVFIMFGIVRYLLGVDLSIAVQTVIAVITTLVALSFHRVKRFFDKITNEFFYQDAYEPQKLFNDFNRVLVAKTELDELITSSLKVIDQYLKSSATLIAIETSKKEARTISTQNWHLDVQKQLHEPLRHYLMQHGMAVADLLGHNESKIANEMSKSNISIVVRLDVSDKGSDTYLGLLVFKPKRSGSPYNDQDIKAIRGVADGLAIAIQNALRFEEIERFNETLQQKVEDATRKLRRSNEKLRQLDETKDDFISMASHQLRTPLTSVKGYVSMVLDGDAGSLTPLQKKLLNQSFISAQRMVYLISDLLNVSRLRTGKFVIEPTPCNLSTIIQEEVKQLVETAKGRGLELVYHKPEHFPLLLLDETKMRQVIMNFIDNAIYYTQSGGTITVNLVETAKSVEFTVVDNGIGVPKAEQHHLFSKFFRAHNAKRARPDGTGLGLFMAKKVIVAQGGAIIFKSQEGKGSTFGFSFAKERILTTEDHVVPGIVTGR